MTGVREDAVFAQAHVLVWEELRSHTRLGHPLRMAITTFSSDQHLGILGQLDSYKPVSQRFEYLKSMSMLSRRTYNEGTQPTGFRGEI
jgi:hypothetical protein